MKMRALFAFERYEKKKGKEKNVFRKENSKINPYPTNVENRVSS